MKNFKQLFVSFALGFGLVMAMGYRGEASVGVRAPKTVTTIGYTTQVSSVTTFTVLESTTGYKKPSAVYQLILSSGVAQDYVVLLDSNAATGYSPTGQTTALQPGQVGPHFMYGSTSANTIFVFDPPLMFYNGIMIMMSAAQDTVSVSWEEGRMLSGN